MNKTYEPKYLKFDDYLIENLKKYKIKFNIFKGNILNETHEIKMTEHLLGIHSFGDKLKNSIKKKSHQKREKYQNVKKSVLFSNTIDETGNISKTNMF